MTKTFSPAGAAEQRKKEARARVAQWLSSFEEVKVDDSRERRAEALMTKLKASGKAYTNSAWGPKC